MALLATPRRAVGLLVFALVAGCSTPEERFAEHVQRAERHANEGDHEEALLEYQNALKIEPDNAEILERMGDVLQDAGTLFDAAMYYRQAHRLDPMRTRAAVS